MMKIYSVFWEAPVFLFFGSLPSFGVELWRNVQNGFTEFILILQIRFSLFNSELFWFVSFSFNRKKEKEMNIKNK